MKYMNKFKKKINEIITEDGREHSYNQAKKKESPAPDSPTTTLSKGWTVILDSACYRIFYFNQATCLWQTRPQIFHKTTTQTELSFSFSV